MAATNTGNDRFNAEAAAWDANSDVHLASDGALQALLATYSSSSSSQPPFYLTKTNPTVEVLEIGCGTGLLSLRLAPYVRSILAIDAAEGMIAALESKLAGPEGGQVDDAEGQDHHHHQARSIITPLCILLEDPEDQRLPPATTTSASPSLEQNQPRQKFDLVISHLVLHHIPDLFPLLKTMYGCLKPGGEVALTDFEDFGPEARKFHPESKMVGVERHGINAEWFAGLMREVGFENVNVKPAWTMEKEVERFPGEWGEVRPTGVDLGKMGFPFLLCRGTKRV